MGSSPGIGQVEHGSRPGRPVGSSGGIPSTVEALRAPPRSESGVVRGSHGVTANHTELSNRILEEKVGNEGVVELGSHRVTPAEKGGGVAWLPPRCSGGEPPPKNDWDSDRWSMA